MTNSDASNAGADVSSEEERAVLREALRAAADKQPPFALNDLLEEWDDEPEFLVRMLGVFVRETHIDINHIVSSFEAKDHSMLARSAHRLKGAAATLGAASIREEAALLEGMGRNENLNDAAAGIEKLRTAFGNFVDSLSGVPLSPETC